MTTDTSIRYFDPVEFIQWLQWQEGQKRYPWSSGCCATVLYDLQSFADSLPYGFPMNLTYFIHFEKDREAREGGGDKVHIMIQSLCTNRIMIISYKSTAAKRFSLVVSSAALMPVHICHVKAIFPFFNQY